MRTSSFVLIAVVLLATTPAVETGVPGETQTSDPSAGYAWAPACKDCHQAEFASWERSKHARALARLGKEEQEKDCLGCHVTGPRVKLEKDGVLQNANVQCEACHGPSATHAADPKVRTPHGKKPRAAACETCHNAKSPSFRGFFYDAMIGLSHPGLKR